MDCAICNKQGRVVYEDAEIMAILLSKGIKEGHIAISSKKHVNIISQVGDETIAKMYILAKKIAGAYAALNTSSFNIVANNRSDEEFHFALNLIPRSEGDNINFQWNPKQIPPEQLGQIFDMIKAIPINPVESKKTEAKQAKKVEIDADGQEDNYMLNQFRRVP